MSCNDKITTRCGKPQYATCVSFEGDVNPQSSLIDEGCLNLEETTQDTYNQLETIYEDINVEDLDYECLSLTNKTLKNLLQLLITQHCNQATLITEMQETIETMQNQTEDLQQNNCP